MATAFPGQVNDARQRAVSGSTLTAWCFAGADLERLLPSGGMSTVRFVDVAAARAALEDHALNPAHAQGRTFPKRAF